MYVKTEPSGHTVFPESGERRERDGCFVRVMCRFYLEPGDPGYDRYEAEHHVYVPVDWDEYNTWVATLPVDKKGNPKFPNQNDPYEGYSGLRHWVLNPLVHRPIFVEPDATDEEIMNIAENYCRQYAEKHARGEQLIITPQKLSGTVATAQRVAACEAKVQELKANVLERKLVQAIKEIE